MGLAREAADKPSPKIKLVPMLPQLRASAACGSTGVYCTVTAITVLWTTPVAEVPVTSTV
jgi:hypothetical protein